METYVYLSLLPEALIASNLAPKDFGTYLAVGTKKRSRGQAIFIEVEKNSISTFSHLSDIDERCKPHKNGEPKHTLYLSIYRVLENVPMGSLKNLYLVTTDGKVIEIERSQRVPEFGKRCYLYQEIVPVHPMIVSSLDPKAFTQFITDKNNDLYVPKICFVDLRLGALSEDPENGSIQDLPYKEIEHLRSCLIELRDIPEKHTKTVDRIHPQLFLYRTIQNGFFLGSHEDLFYYPFPSEEDLKNRYYDWWRSASM